MLGLVCYRNGGEKNGTRTVHSVRFGAVFVERGEGVRARLSAKRAARYLKKRQIHRAVFPPDYPHTAIFEKAGIFPVEELPLRMAKAEEIIRCAMRALGIPPENARAALISSAPNAFLAQTAAALAHSVRYLTLCTPDGERLVRALRWDSGVSVYSARKGETLRADLAVAFDASAPVCDCPRLNLTDSALLISYDAPKAEREERLGEKRQLLAALFSAGALRAEEITIKTVEFPAKTGEKTILP